MKKFFHPFFRTLSCVAGFLAHGVMFCVACYYLLSTPPEVQSGPGGVGASYFILYYCLACGALGMLLALLDGLNNKGWFAALGLLLCATPVLSGVAAANLVALFH